MHKEETRSQVSIFEGGVVWMLSEGKAEGMRTASTTCRKLLGHARRDSGMSSRAGQRQSRLFI